MLTMMMSIAHRITGAALYFGMVGLVWWLTAVASGAEYFAFVDSIVTSIPGRVVLFGFTWALIHHLLGGLRHLLWDTGRGFDLGQVEWMARATIAGSVVVTVVVWAIAYAVR